jgi:hypothetical protein
MRLVICVIVLIVTALDAWFGQGGAAIKIAGFVAGGLLALSAIVDLVIPEQRGTETPESEADASEAAAPPARDAASD